MGCELNKEYRKTCTHRHQLVAAADQIFCQTLFLDHTKHTPKPSPRSVYQCSTHPVLFSCSDIIKESVEDIASALTLYFAA